MSAPRQHPLGRAGGFTLLEVLIALAVLALALAAVIGTAGSSTRAAANLRDKTFAHWVAMNRVTEARVATDWPDTGTSDGHSEMAGRRWYWRMTVSTTADEALRRLDVDVLANQDDQRPATSLTAFVGKPAPPGTSTGAAAGTKAAANQNGDRQQHQRPSANSSGGPS